MNFLRARFAFLDVGDIIDIVDIMWYSPENWFLCTYSIDFISLNVIHFDSILEMWLGDFDRVERDIGESYPSQMTC